MAGATDVVSRLAVVERTLERMDRDMVDNRKTTAQELSKLRNDLSDKIDEVVKGNALAEHNMSQEFKASLMSLQSDFKETVRKMHETFKESVQETNRRVDILTDVANKINGKLSIHQFIFGALAAVSLAAIGAWFKAAVDLWFRK